MGGDLEEFLKRAAARRQAKAADGQANRPPPQPVEKPRPEYTNKKRERVIQSNDVVEQPLQAQVVDSLHERHRVEDLEKAKLAAKQKAAAEKIKAIQATQNIASAPKTSQKAEAQADDLLALLRQPGGIRQAILLREILDRPEHRW